MASPFLRLIDSITSDEGAVLAELQDTSIAYDAIHNNDSKLLIVCNLRLIITASTAEALARDSGERWRIWQTEFNKIIVTNPALTASYDKQAIA